MVVQPGIGRMERSMVESGTILLVEDEPIIALMEQQKLRGYGYNVLLSANRESTLKVINSDHPIDIILMDIDLGEGEADGTAIAEEILLTRSIPIIFLSSHTEQEIVDRTEKISSYGYIVKGCNDTILLASIRMAYKLHQSYMEKEHNFARLQGVITGTNVGTWEWNVQTGETLFNERWAEIIGRSLEELQPLSFETWRRFVHPEDFIKSSLALEEHFNGKTELYECRVRMKHLDGHWVWIEARGSVITHTETGRPEWVFGMHTDITEQIRLEEAILKSENKYRALFENIEMGFALHRVVRNTDGAVTDYEFIETNESFGRLTGLEPDAIKGKRVTEVIPGIENDPGHWIERYAEVVESGKSIQFESLSEVLGRWYSVTAYKPQPEMFATLFFDTTDNRQLMQELEQSVGVQKVLMKELSHRVKNNLLMVSSLIHLKAVESETDLSDIESRVTAIANLYEELQQTVQVDRVPLHSYIMKIAGNVANNFHKRIDLVMDLAEQDVPTQTAVSIGLIVNEIITNAVKHGFSSDRIEFPKLEIRSSIEGGGMISISNNGLPLPVDFNLENPKTLGLQLIITLAKQINGRITISRKPLPCFTIRYNVSSGYVSY